MRRRTRQPIRPHLPRRAIVWFPPPDAMAAVEAFRARCDPRAPHLAAHVTLVFPFSSSLTALQIATHVRRVVGGWPVLPVTLAGCDVFEGQWVHLKITRGREALRELHHRLHRGVLAPFLRSEFRFEPHLTIGRAADVAACNAMLDEAGATLGAPIEATVDSLSVLTLRTTGQVDRHAAIPLGGE